jgi:Secretion system C-terminal sorting domain
VTVVIGIKILYSINCRHYYKRIPFTFIFSVFFSLTAFAQTNISGIVNTYHKVVEIIPAKACVRVADISGLNVNSRLMLVQMKGATINTTTTSAFGDTTSLNGAGNYEIGAVCYIIGDSVFLFHNLLNTYNTSTGKVQLVQFAEYFSANIVDTIKAASWDSTSGKGGVIAIFATQDITLNAPIYADSSGNKGGAYYNNSGTCNFIQQAGTAYAYDITSSSNLNGAYKGECVADIPSSVNSAKGAPANGGGGGNNHNNSGGGGANLTSGGIGGGNSSNGPTGCNVGNNWGRGGKALSSWSGAKIFMGGGGGAGHSNNGSVLSNYGGNGGGIIFIWAANLIGNNYPISANGGNGGGSNSDGAGGGGAGGSIVMHVTNYTGNVFIKAEGGSGGLSDDGGNIGRCFGGGGGGSGGAIYFTGPSPAVTVSNTGGTAGAEINRDPGCNSEVPAAAGIIGQIIANYTFPRSTDPAGYCQLLLPSKLLYFNAQLINHSVLLIWKLEHPEFAKHFIVEKKIENGSWENYYTINSNDNISAYSIADHYPKNGNNFYRLKVVEKNNTEYYSETRKIIVGVYKKDFMVYPNPAIEKIIVSVNYETGYLLQILDISGTVKLEQKILTNTSEIILPRLTAGLYILRYNGMTKKLIIR